jgi:hypothetical protein
VKGLDKITATLLFQRLGIEGLPGRVYPAGERPDRVRLAEDYGPEHPLMLRTAAPGEERNLPRVAGLASVAAAEWIAELEPHLGVIVQPYDDVVFSVEVAAGPDGPVVAEIVPGIWELDTIAVPVRATITAGGVSLEAAPTLQPARFFGLVDGYVTRPAQVQGWQITMTTKWVTTHRDALAQLVDEVGGPCALKLHYSPRYGLSPQNVRLTGPIGSFAGTPPPPRAVVVADVETPVPEGTRVVVIDLSVAREDAPLVVAFAAQLAAVGVEAAWVRSGLLSHLAICLREAGIDVYQEARPPCGA